MGKVKHFTKNSVDREYLMWLAEYNPETGVFIRKQKTARIGEVGDVMGHVNELGYRIIKIKGSAYKAHRLAWLYIYGEFPDGDIDHINGNTDDNRISNLRSVSARENTLNKSIYREDGYIPGATQSATGKWYPTIRDGDSRHRLGSYDTAEEAQKVYAEVKARLDNGEHLEDFYMEYSSSRERKILCVEKNKVYNNASEAAKDVGCAPTNITQACKGRYKTIKGFHWKYMEDENV